MNEVFLHDAVTTDLDKLAKVKAENVFGDILNPITIEEAKLLAGELGLHTIHWSEHTPRINNGEEHVYFIGGVKDEEITHRFVVKRSYYE